MHKDFEPRTRPRRDFLIGAGFGTAALTGAVVLSRFGHQNSQKPDVIITNATPTPDNNQQVRSELILEPDSVVGVRPFKSGFTGKVGIDEMRIFYDGSKNMAVVSYRPDNDSEIVSGKLANELSIERSFGGFVDYDPNYDVAKAISTLKQRRGAPNPLPYSLTEMSQILSMMWQTRNIAKMGSSFTPIPQTNTEQMIASSGNFTKPKNSNSPTDFSTEGILRLRIRFLPPPAQGQRT